MSACWFYQKLQIGFSFHTTTHIKKNCKLNMAVITLEYSYGNINCRNSAWAAEDFPAPMSPTHCLCLRNINILIKTWNLYILFFIQLHRLISHIFVISFPNHVISRPSLSLIKHFYIYQDLVKRQSRRCIIYATTWISSWPSSYPSLSICLYNNTLNILISVYTICKDK